MKRARPTSFEATLTRALLTAFAAALSITAAGGCKSAATKTSVAAETSPPQATADAKPPGPRTLGEQDVVASSPKPDASAETSASTAPIKVTSRRVYTGSIPDAATFKAYSRKVGTERFTKFIVDLKTDQIYFFDVNIYKLHVDFTFKELYKRPQTNQALIEFNKNYEVHKPEFLLCYLVHHTDLNLWTMAFWEGDLATPAHVARAHKRLTESFYGGADVKFRPDSTLQEALLGKPELAGIPTITNDKIYKSAPYQAFTTGQSVGRLRIIGPNAAKTPLAFSDEDIVILTEVLPDITPVRGIISERFSTPLAHVALRARAWGVPHVGMKKAAQTFAALEGKWVHFEASASGATLRLATKAELTADRLERAKARTVKLPPADLTHKELKWLPKIRATEAGAFGAKTANLGEIAFANMPGFSVPSGFGVPVAHYASHMSAHGFDKRAAALVAEPRFQKDPAYRAASLTKLRADIVSKPMSKALKRSIKRHLARLPGGPRRAVFVRSSTNAEDLPGFNGAGLYDTAPNVRGDDRVFEAVKKVWASVWNLRAYEERAHFGIDHRGVYGAVLIQSGVNATAAGVLITANIFDPKDPTTYTINAKSGLGIRVVEGKKVPEQLLFDVRNFGIKVLSRSDEDTMLVFDRKGGVKEVPNPAKGKPVLSDDRATRLSLAARSLTDLFPKDHPLDIEWLFEGDALHIVQARPYIGL